MSAVVPALSLSEALTHSEVMVLLLTWTMALLVLLSWASSSEPTAPPQPTGASSPPTACPCRRPSRTKPTASPTTTTRVVLRSQGYLCHVFIVRLLLLLARKRDSCARSPHRPGSTHPK